MMTDVVDGGASTMPAPNDPTRDANDLLRSRAPTAPPTGGKRKRTPPREPEYERSFASFDPAKVACWSARNELTPRQVARGSATKFWFTCDGGCGHEFETSLSSITGKGTWCPYCATFNARLCNDDECSHCYDRSFASFDEKKVACWAARNALRPRLVNKKSGKKFFFDCDGGCGHEFSDTLSHIVGSGRWCPYCQGRRHCHDTGCASCHERSFAGFHDQTKVACWATRNILSPRQVLTTSSDKFWFKCAGGCGHEFESQIHAVSRPNGTWCPYCAGKRLCDDTSCGDCYRRSFASFKDGTRLACWSTRNALTPRQVTMHCNDKFWFTCDGDCGHDFETTLGSITGQSTWCPYCAGQRLCDDDDCNHCHDRSFANLGDEDKVACWSSRNTIAPRQAALNSGKEFWFTCGNGCGHDFRTSLDQISSKGRWCPYCSGRRLCDDTECSHCHDRSFIVFEDVTKVACWSERNDLHPRHVALHSNSKFWFTCERGHEFKATLSNITGKARSWCPRCCDSKSEARAAAVLEEMGLTFTPQYRLPGQTRGGFDFAVMRDGELSFLLELDGEQHFHPVTFGSTTRTGEECLQDAVERDERKEAMVAALGARLLRVPYTRYDTPAGIRAPIENFIEARHGPGVIVRVDEQLYASRPFRNV